MAAKINKMPPLTVMNLDMHTHIYTNFRPQARWLEHGSRDLGWLINTLIKGNINAVGITNFEDWNYEFWTSNEQLKELPKNWNYYKDERVLAVSSNSYDSIYFFKSQEIPTEQGHVLLFGGESGKNLPTLSLDEILSLSKEDSCLIVIASHPNSKYGLGKNLQGKSKMFDAYEFNASSSKEENEKTIEQSKQDKVPLVSSSDSHIPSQIGKSYIRIPSYYLSSTSGKEFIKSIKSSITKEKFAAYMKYSPRKFSTRHISLNLIYHFVLKKINHNIVNPDFAKPR